MGDCDYHPGGCTISKAAPKYSACQCKYKGAWTCGGEVVRCPKEDDERCISPDLSNTSCIFGGGDCGGYDGDQGCDCDYKGKGFLKASGCVISKAAPRYTACKCHYEGAWTCSGEVVRCKLDSRSQCKNPDKSEASCQLGGGDCDGY